MLYRPSSIATKVQEPPFPYLPSQKGNIVYEISLRIAFPSYSLKDLPHAHRLSQTLLRGELLDYYELLDFVIWPEGLFTRIRLKSVPSLAEFLKFLKEKSTPPDLFPSNFWDEELQWVRIVPPEGLSQSTRLFLEKADSLRRTLNASGGFLPRLFFFYRNPRLNP